jgi:hypothetical protein
MEVCEKAEIIYSVKRKNIAVDRNWSTIIITHKKVSQSTNLGSK